MKITIDRFEASAAAKAILYSIANSTEDTTWSKHLVIKLMAHDMSLLCLMAVRVYDDTGNLPDLYWHIKAKLGEHRAGEFSAHMKTLRGYRAAEGKDLPVIFVDENGVAENVVYMANFEHLRRAA